MWQTLRHLHAQAKEPAETNQCVAGTFKAGGIDLVSNVGGAKGEFFLPASGGGWKIWRKCVAF